LVEQVARAQRPDGTFEGGNGWTLQRLMAMTAHAIAAVRADTSSPRAKQQAAGASLRAEGAFERNLERIDDGYTAAVVVASGVVSGSIRDRLRAVVKKAIRDNKDGSRSLPVDANVVRGNGSTPTEVEATAYATLALLDDKDSAKLLPDLGSSLLASYRAGFGWGDGETNLAALRATLALFKDPIPDKISIHLSLDGVEIATGQLEGKSKKEVLALEAETSHAAGAHRFFVEAKPAVPGLGFSLTLKGYVPWQAERGSGGLELEAKPPKDLIAGRPAEVVLRAVAPSGSELTLVHAVPAGVQADKPSLEALVSSGTIRSFETADGAITLHVPAREPGQGWNASYRVIPTLSGTLHSSASTFGPEAASESAAHVPPAVWSVR
jgi:hypothetical protein